MCGKGAGGAARGTLTPLVFNTAAALLLSLFMMARGLLCVFAMYLGPNDTIGFLGFGGAAKQLVYVAGDAVTAALTKPRRAGASLGASSRVCCSEHCWCSIIPAAGLALMSALLEPGIPRDWRSQRRSRSVCWRQYPGQLPPPSVGDLVPSQFQGSHHLYVDVCGGERKRGGTGANRV